MPTGSDCLIEWDELNNPVSVVDRKNVKSVDGDSEPDVGEMCSIRCCERSRWVEYPGKLLAVGSKEMELEMARLDDLGLSDGEDEGSAQVTSEAEKTVFKGKWCLFAIRIYLSFISLILFFLQTLTVSLSGMSPILLPVLWKG